MPQLEEFGDIDDADALNKNIGTMRRSFTIAKKREVFNTVIGDCTLHRIEKDIMAQSVSDSMAGTGFGSAKPGNGRRTVSTFKRRTGSSFGGASPGLRDASPGLRDGPV